MQTNVPSRAVSVPGMLLYLFLSRNWLLVWVSLWVIDSNTVFTFSWWGVVRVGLVFGLVLVVSFGNLASCLNFDRPHSFVLAWKLRVGHAFTICTYTYMYIILYNHKYMYSILMHKYQIYIYICTNISKYRCFLFRTTWLWVWNPTKAVFHVAECGRHDV